jgi:hypothetical protein
MIDVQCLIEMLQDLPPDAPVMILFDGALRSEVHHAWQTKDGRIGLGPRGAAIYYDSDRPVNAPSEGRFTLPGEQEY